MGEYRDLIAPVEPSATTTAFAERVHQHQQRIRVQWRRHVFAEENALPIGQAADWYYDLIPDVPLSAMLVARQLARLCVDDSQVTLPWRSLADAVGRRDHLGRERAYVERGVECLVTYGWLDVRTEGKGRGARTTFSLLPGPRTERMFCVPAPVLDDVEEYVA